MAGRFEEDTFSSFVSGIGESAKRLKTNFESIFEKYGRQFPDDDVVDLLNMKISRDKGRLRKYKGCFTYGASRLKSTKRRDEIFRKLAGSKNSHADPDVSSAVADRCISVLNDTVDTRDEDTSDAETLSSDNSEDVEEDCGSSKEDSSCEIVDVSDELNDNEDDIQSKEEMLNGGVLDEDNESKDNDCGSKSIEDEDDDESKGENDVERNYDDEYPEQACDSEESHDNEFQELYDSTKEINSEGCHHLGNKEVNVLTKNANSLSQKSEFSDSFSMYSERPRKKSESLAFVSISSPVRKSPTSDSISSSILNSSRSTSISEKRSPRKCTTYLIEKYPPPRSSITGSETVSSSPASAHRSQRFRNGSNFLKSPEHVFTTHQKVNGTSPQNLKERILLETSVASSPEARHRKRSAVDVNMNVVSSPGRHNVVSSKSPTSVDLSRKGTKRVRTLSSSDPWDESLNAISTEPTSPCVKNSFSPGLSASFKKLDLRKGYQKLSPASLRQQQICERKPIASRRVPQSTFAKTRSEVQRSVPVFSPENILLPRSPSGKSGSQHCRGNRNSLQGVRRSLSHRYSSENQDPRSINDVCSFLPRSTQRVPHEDMERMKPQVREFSSSSGFCSSDDSFPPTQSHTCSPPSKHVLGNTCSEQVIFPRSYSGSGKGKRDQGRYLGASIDSQAVEAVVEDRFNTSEFQELPLRPPITITKVPALKKQAMAFTKTYCEGVRSQDSISGKRAERRPVEETEGERHVDARSMHPVTGYWTSDGEASRGNYVENWVAASSGDAEDVAYHFASCPPKVLYKWTPAHNGRTIRKDSVCSPQSGACLGRTGDTYNGAYEDTQRFQQQMSRASRQNQASASIPQSIHGISSSSFESRYKRPDVCPPSYLRTVQSSFSDRSALDHTCPSMNPSPSAFTDFRHQNGGCCNHMAIPSTQDFTRLRRLSLKGGHGQDYSSDHLLSQPHSPSGLTGTRPVGSASSSSGWMVSHCEQPSLYSPDSELTSIRYHRHQQKVPLPQGSLPVGLTLCPCLNCSPSRLESVPGYGHSSPVASSVLRRGRETLYGSFERARGDGQVSSHTHTDRRLNSDNMLVTNETKFNSLYARAFDAWREIQMKIPAEDAAAEEVGNGTKVDDSFFAESSVLDGTSPRQPCHTRQRLEMRNLPVLSSSGRRHFDVSKLLEDKKMLSRSFVESHSILQKPGAMKKQLPGVNTQNKRSKGNKPMFPSEYIERFSPLNPNRIDSDSSMHARSGRHGVHKTGKTSPRSPQSQYPNTKPSTPKHKDASFPSPVFCLYPENVATMEKGSSGYRSPVNKGTLAPPQTHGHRDVINSTFIVRHDAESSHLKDTDGPPPVFKVPANPYVSRRTGKSGKQVTADPKQTSFKRASTPVPRTSRLPVMTLDDSLSTIYDCKDSAVADSEWEADREGDIDLV